MPFLTLLDDRARPKGSRDPLGFELVWTYFGRKVVGNLTTITSSLENFSVALLGFHFANQLVINVEPDGRHKAVRGYFLCYEQVAAYLRYYQGSKSIMGINRVSQRIQDETNKSLPIGIHPERQILSDQASYGMWGLYSSAMRDTGLISGADRNLTAVGMEIARTLEGKLDKSSLIRFFKADKVLKEELQKYATVFMSALNDEQINQKLLENLLNGSGNKDLQVELWEKTRWLIHNQSLPDTKNALIERLVAIDISSSLKIQLQRIQEIERVLVAINNVFHYCRSQHGVDLGTVIKKLEEQDYDYAYLPGNLSDSDFPHKDMIEGALLSLKSRDYRKLIVQVIELNKTVMKQRKGAAWVEVESGKKLSVVMKNETAQLLTHEQLQTRWDYDYFLGSFLQMARNYKNFEVVGQNTNG